MRGISTRLTQALPDVTIPAMKAAMIVQKYLSDHPSVRDCLKKGFINYSALSREICSHFKSSAVSFDAVLIACRRASRRLKSDDTSERRITSLVKRARIRFKNKIAVCIAEKPKDLEKLISLQKAVRSARGDFSVVEGEDSVTVALSADYLPDLKELMKGRIIKVTTDLAQITMMFDERIEITPGVVSFVYGLLAENNINIQEELSCWTDLMMVVSESDAAKAMQVLSLR